MRATTALAIFCLFLGPGIAAAQAPTATAPSAPSSTMSPRPGHFRRPQQRRQRPSHPRPHRPATAPPRRWPSTKTEADAKGACGSDPIVWANTSSKILHANGDKYDGHTTHGAYVCQSAAQKAGYHAAK